MNGESYMLNQIVHSQTIANTPHRKLPGRPPIVVSMATEVENTKKERKKQIHSMLAQPDSKLKESLMRDEFKLEEDESTDDDYTIKTLALKTL